MKAKSFSLLLTFALYCAFAFTSSQVIASNYTPCCQSNKRQLNALQLSLSRTQKQVEEQRKKLNTLTTAHNALQTNFTNFTTSYHNTLRVLRSELNICKTNARLALQKKLSCKVVIKRKHNPPVGKHIRVYCPSGSVPTGGGFDTNSRAPVEHSLVGSNFYQCRLQGPTSRLDCYVVCCTVK